MKYSFVIINKNGERTLKRCIESIKRIAPDKSEIIVVDDKSDDSSREIAEGFADKLVSNNKTFGIGKSRNKGLSAAKGRYVFIIDSDIELKHVSFSEIETEFENNEIVAISGSYSSLETAYDWNTVLDLRRKYIYGKNSTKRVVDINNYTTFSGGFCILDTAKTKSIKFLKRSNYAGEDLVYQISLLNKGYKTLYLPSFRGKHHHIRHGKNIFVKIMQDVNGSLWTTLESSKDGSAVPYLEQVLSFPLFLFLAFLIPNPVVSAILIIFEFTPYLAVISKEKFSSPSIQLLFHAITVSLLKIPFLFLWLIFTNFSISQKIGLIKHSLLSDFIVKAKLIKNII